MCLDRCILGCNLHPQIFQSENIKSPKKFCYNCYIDYDTIQKLGLDDEDSEGMTNYLRKVEGTEIAIYVRGREDGTNKVSMRSGGKIDVSKIAIQFGGGGHARAAGYTMYDDIEIEKKKLLDVVEVMLK